MDYLLLISVIISFLLVAHFTPLWIRKCRSANLLWEDMNKFKHPKNVASSGGIIVVMAFILGIFFYIALKTFVYSGTVHTAELFALVSMVLILGIVGLVDDLLGWKNGGLPRRIRLLLAFTASIPLVIINAGNPYITLPLLGPVNAGILYSLVFIPLGIAGATTTFNFLAGFNGLEAGQGILILSYLSFVAYLSGSAWLAIAGLCMVGALLGFYLFNKFPAKIFPGDILTYSIGALIAGMAIIGNFEKAALIAFIPYFMEIFLKIRGGLKKQSFGIPKKDGTLQVPYDKFYSLTHISIAILNKFGKATEKKVTYLIHAFQVACILLSMATL